MESIDTTVKENVKCKRLLTPNIQEIQDTMEKNKPKDNSYRRQRRFPT
jgi:hypothetical protein